MLLGIDIGNTNVVLGLMEKKSGKVLQEARFSSQSKKTQDEIFLELQSFFSFHQIDKEKIEDAILSSVVPFLTQSYEKALEKFLKKKILVIGPGVKTGLNIKIDTPSQLGADLVVGAVGALAKYTPPLLIFDLGTATTLSVIDEKGAFVGGQILTGIRLSLEALGSQTAQLPYVDLAEKVALVGKNTLDCLRAGALFGHAAMIDGLIDKMEKHHGKKFTVVATGGLFSVVAPHCEKEIYHEKDLLFHGLFQIYLRNRKEEVCT